MKRTRRVYRFTVDGVEKSVDVDIEHGPQLLEVTETVLRKMAYDAGFTSIEPVEIRDITYVVEDES